MPSRTFVVLASTAWCLAAPGVAAAQAAVAAETEGSIGVDRPPPTAAELAEAEHSFELGMQAFDSGDYETAASEFRAARELTQHPDLWFNIYLAEERGGRLDAAADALARYLAEGTIEPEQRGLLERRLERLRGRVAAHAGSGAAPIATPEEQAEEALAQQPIRDTGTAIGSPTSDPASGGVAPSTEGGGGPPIAAIATLAAAGVLAIAFAVLAPLSEVEDQSLASSCGRESGRWCGSSDLTTLEALNIAADVSWIGAAVLGTLGVVLFVALPSDDAPRATASISPWAGPESAGIRVRAQL